VRRFLWDDEIIDPARTQAIVAESQRLFATDGHGLYGARMASSGELVGFGGFWSFREPPELELLFGLAEPYWNRGLATELAAAVLRDGLTRLRFANVRASADAANAASVRVLEKLGFACDRRATVDNLDTLFFGYEPMPVRDTARAAV
jgi:[ribosomal protein S5]-alanine N-acetyltransferase